MFEVCVIVVVMCYKYVFGSSSDWMNLCLGCL